MPRTVISGLVCITFLMLLEFSAVPQEPARKGADTESGQLTFNNACRTCHTTKEGDNRLGPNLHNIIGRKAGSQSNYGYSSAMKGADFVWDKEKLDRFIANPDEVVPGNNMKPYGRAHIGRGSRRSDRILGVARYQLSGCVALIQGGRMSSRLSRNRGSGGSYAALHCRGPGPVSDQTDLLCSAFLDTINGGGGCITGRQHRRHDEVTAGMAVECARADEVITECAG
jgi:cytochrome c